MPLNTPDVLDELLTLATSAIYEARRAGGNQYRLLLAPPLTVLDDPHEGTWAATDQSAKRQRDIGDLAPHNG